MAFNRWLSKDEVIMEDASPILIEAYEFARKDAAHWMDKYYATVKERRMMWDEIEALKKEHERLAGELRKAVADATSSGS